MIDYIRYILPYRRSFYTISLQKRDIVYFENMAVKFLKVRDLNELRDKFEGQAFLNNLLQKALPITALQKYLKIEFYDFNNVQADKILSEISINSRLINIVKFDQKLPLIDIENDNPYIFIHSIENQSMEICGFLSADDARKSLKDVKRYGFGSKETLKGAFYGFSSIKVFQNYDELRILVEEAV